MQKGTARLAGCSFYFCLFLRYRKISAFTNHAVAIAVIPKYQFQSIKTFIREVISSLGWKRYRWFVKYIAKGGDNLEAILRKQKRKDVIVQLLAIPEPYQHQNYMRQLMDFALQTAKSYDLPLVIETDEKLKCDKYGHFGVKLVNKRDFGDDRYGYGMICEN